MWRSCGGGKPEMTIRREPEIREGHTIYAGLGFHDMAWFAPCRDIEGSLTSRSPDRLRRQYKRSAESLEIAEDSSIWLATATRGRHTGVVAYSPPPQDRFQKA